MGAAELAEAADAARTFAAVEAAAAGLVRPPGDGAPPGGAPGISTHRRRSNYNSTSCLAPLTSRPTLAHASRACLAGLGGSKHPLEATFYLQRAACWVNQ